MFSNKLKKGSVALATVAVVTSMMIGSAFAGSKSYHCNQAGPFDWSSKVFAKTTTKHKKGKSEAIKPTEDTTATIKSTSKFNGQYAKDMYDEAKKDGYAYAVSYTLAGGDAIFYIDRKKEKGNYCALFRVLGSPIVGSAIDEDGNYLDQQKIDWIGMPSRTEVTYIKK